MDERERMMGMESKRKAGRAGQQEGVRAREKTLAVCGSAATTIR